MAKNRNSSDATKASNKPNLNSINLSTKKTGVTDDLIASIKAKETIAVEPAVVKDEVKEETSISKPVLAVSPIAESTKPAKQIKNTNSTKSTDGAVVMKNVAVSLLPDDDMYLKLKAAEAGKKINAFFVKLFSYLSCNYHFFDLCLKIIPIICIAINGISATKAITPNESSVPPQPFAAPIVKDNTKVEVSGPDATPPESNAIPVNKSGEKSIKTIAMIYPGIKI